MLAQIFVYRNVYCSMTLCTDLGLCFLMNTKLTSICVWDIRCKANPADACLKVIDLHKVYWEGFVIIMLRSPPHDVNILYYGTDNTQCTMVKQTTQNHIRIYLSTHTHTNMNKLKLKMLFASLACSRWATYNILVCRRAVFPTACFETSQIAYIALYIYTRHMCQYP